MRFAVVTGASAGIGEAYARRLGADGHDLLLMGRDATRLEAVAGRVASEHGVKVHTVQGDLGDRRDLERLCDEIPKQRIDLLVNNAGLAYYMDFAALPVQQADEMLAVNALAPIRLMEAVMPAMLERGSGAIINVASLLAFSRAVTGPLPRRAVYAATKAMLVTFSQIVDSEVRERGVRVQVVCPGLVRSLFHSRQGIDMSALERMEPEEVVAASLADLAAGVMVSVPALEDLSLLDRLDQTADELMLSARTPRLAARYGRSAVTTPGDGCS